MDLFDRSTTYHFINFNCILYLVNPLSPHGSLKNHFTYLKKTIDFPTTKGFRSKMSMKLFYQYMTIFFTFSPT